mgnify:CR=1 FL=1
MKKVYVFLAEGFEEMEAVTPIDLLRRAGVDAKLVSVTGNRAVTGAHGVTYLADLLFEEIEEDADMLVLPGGLPEARRVMDWVAESFPRGAVLFSLMAQYTNSYVFASIFPMRVPAPEVLCKSRWFWVLWAS